MTRLPRRAIAGALLVSAIATAGALISPGGASAVLESIAGDPVRFTLVLAGLYLVRPLFAWPTTPLSFVVGYGLGVTFGVPIALVGVVVTVTPVFFAVRWAVSDPTTESLETLPFGETLDRAGSAIGRYYRTAGPIRGVVASRLAPLPSDVATCAAAGSGVSYPQFVVGTVLGELPWTVAAVVVGSSAATVSTRGLGQLGAVVTVGCLLAIVALLAGPFVRTFRTESAGQGRHEEESSPSSDSR
ncbi:hypothetical protein EL22_02080 [Halostagnicola sp. A56]|uniref:TVP38/TMEM64 family protein n=1 Tax=Halostagnicola sp. A56 TaxID=1495067 RepID=UPI00049F5402|nr:VTT domain-containing protein [Halostagnicola sp. A56]KDE60315.1 hypothetical protein EL22_02080 [Halostagnicola sp. A56]